MPFKIPDFTKNAKGGTELMTARITKYLTDNAPELLDFFDFYPSRVRDYDSNRPSVLILNDLCDDPESAHLVNGGWKNFDLIVFVSNWQFQQYQKKFNLDGSNCIVIPNGIEQIDQEALLNVNMHGKWQGYNKQVKLIYHTTPHRGLEILVPAFIQLYDEVFQPNNIDVVLDVYSSFGVYGWADRDEQYKELFETCKNHPAINYHGAVSNEVVRDALSNAHIFTYPNIWCETSCLSLIEAMQARCICIHPNYGALIETSCGLTDQYVYKTDTQEHLEYFKAKLEKSVRAVHENWDQSYINVEPAANIANQLYSFDKIGPKWREVLSSLKKAVEQSVEVD